MSGEELIQILVTAAVLGLIGYVVYQRGRPLRIMGEARGAFATFDGFGLVRHHDELRGTVDGYRVKAMQDEPAIAVELQREPELYLSSFAAAGESDDGADESSDGHEALRLDDPLLDGYFRYATATTEVRRLLLADDTTMSRLRELVGDCRERVGGLEMVGGILKLTTETVTEKAIHSYLHPDEIRTWLPLMLRLAQALDAIAGLGPRRDHEDEDDWSWGRF